MTGFRVAKGGAQEILGITPISQLLGKLLVEVYPLALLAENQKLWKKSLHRTNLPSRNIERKSTCNECGICSFIIHKENPNIYNLLEEKSSYLENGFSKNLEKLGKNYATNRVGSMMCMFFTEEKVDNFNSAVKSDTELYGKYFHKMLENGIYLAPAQFEALFVSTVHTKEDLDKTIEAHYKSLIDIL